MEILTSTEAMVLLKLPGMSLKFLDNEGMIYKLITFKTFKTGKNGQINVQFKIVINV